MPPASFSYEKNEAFDELAAGEDAIFESNFRLLIFAACLGHAKNRRVSDPEKNGEIRWSYIEQNQKLSIIAASLAFAAEDDAEALIEPETQIDVLVEYGAGGARILKEKVVDAPGSNLDNLISFLQQNRDEEKITEQIGILEEIEREVSQL